MRGVSVVTDGWDSEEFAAPPQAFDAPPVGRPDDEQLQVALRRAIRSRQDVPPEFVQAAKDVFAWHDIDADLAQLTYDSVRGPDLAGSRTRAEDATIRALTFTSARLTIELEVTRSSRSKMPPSRSTPRPASAPWSPPTRLAVFRSDPSRAVRSACAARQPAESTSVPGGSRCDTRQAAPSATRDAAVA